MFSVIIMDEIDEMDKISYLKKQKESNLIN